MICERSTRHRLAVLPFAALALLGAMSLSEPAVSKDRSEKADEQPPTRPAGTPVLALVSLQQQQVTIYDADGPILKSPVSSGQTDYETPVGIYAVLQKEAEHYSNVYDDAAMPHMQRITWSGVALHGGALPGYPASHGCVRLPYKFAERLFGLTKVGLRVIIARDNVAPIAISHPLLFKRTPYSESGGIVTKAAALVGTVLGQSKSGDEPADVAERATALQAIMAAKTAEADAAEKRAEPGRALVKQREPEMKAASKALKAAEKAVATAEKVQKRADERVADAEKDLTSASANAKSPKAVERANKAMENAKEAKAKADTKLAEAQAKLDATKAEAQPKIDAYSQAADAVKAVEGERDAARAEARAAERKLSPVSVFISLKTQKLYVRQGFEPVFESPVTIADPAKPIGTHTYTAVAYGKDGRDMRWNVVSIGGRQPGESAYEDGYEDTAYNADEDEYYFDRPRRRRPARTTTATESKPTDIAAATAALDRITIPADVVERISELVLPGTSLIVSDEEAHKETGKQTDFVVLISGEPQGGIKKRPRQMNPYYEDFYGYDDYYDRRGRRGRPPGGPFFRWW
jgi:hypothetical protein